MALRILLADDHTIMRNGLRLLLERQPDFTVVGEASNGREAIELTDLKNPDVVIMDIAMPIMNGIEATARITAAQSKTAVVVLIPSCIQKMTNATAETGPITFCSELSLSSFDRNSV